MQAAQILHAAGESSPGNLPPGTIGVVLTTPDERALTALAGRLDALGVRYVRIYEDSAPYAGALMSLGLRPARKEDLRRHLSSLPLLR